MSSLVVLKMEERLSGCHDVHGLHYWIYECTCARARLCTLFNFYNYLQLLGTTLPFKYQPVYCKKVTCIVY